MRCFGLDLCSFQRQFCRMHKPSILHQLPERALNIEPGELEAMGLNDEQIATQAFNERYADERWLREAVEGGRMDSIQARGLDRLLLARFRAVWGKYADTALE